MKHMVEKTTIVQGRLLTHHAVMKKTSGGDSPLWQGARKSFWTLPILGRQQQQIMMCFRKIDWVFRSFPSGGIYRRKGSVRRWARWTHQQGARARGWPRHPVVWLARGPLHLLFGLLEALVNIWRFGFCFVQF
jgi:hypothetical protein